MNERIFILQFQLISELISEAKRSRVREVSDVKLDAANRILQTILKGKDRAQ